MKNDELNKITKELVALVSEVSDSKETRIDLKDYSNYDLSEIEKPINDNSTLEEIKTFLKTLRKITGIQKKIIIEVERSYSPTLNDYAKIGEPIISDCGNYYTVEIEAVRNSSTRYSNPNKSTKFCWVYDKNGNVLLPLDIENKEIHYLDDNNFFVEPQCPTRNLTHYRVKETGIEKIFECVYSNDCGKYSFSKNMSEWRQKGLAIIVQDEDREYLYSFKESKVLSYGFTKIESIENCDWNKTDYTKEYNCCQVTLIVSSDIDPTIYNTLIGYIDEEGNLVNSFLNLDSGEIILTPSGKEKNAERAMKKALDSQASKSLETQKLLMQNKDRMVMTLRNKATGC